MRWCLGLVLLGALVLAPPARAQDPEAWQAECRSERPLRTDKCRVVHYSNDQADAVRLAGYVIRDLNLDPKRFPPRSVHGTISMAKNENVGPEEYAAEAAQIFQRKLSEVYFEYQKRLLTAGAMAFSATRLSRTVLVRRRLA